MIKIMIIIFIFIIFTLTGCGNTWIYRGKYTDLHSVAVYSLLGINSNFADYIRVIDEDQYGRILFVFMGRDNVNYKKDFFALLILQKTEDGETYFYEDSDYIISDKDGYIDDLVFSDEEIADLKERNDWNKEINEELCTKVFVSKRKDPIGDLDINVIESTFFDQVQIEENKRIWISILNEDEYGRNLYFVQVWEPNKGVDTYNERYVMMLFEEGTYNEETYILEIEDIWNYQDTLKNFKELHDWHKPF